MHRIFVPVALLCLIGFLQNLGLSVSIVALTGLCLIWIYTNVKMGIASALVYWFSWFVTLMINMLLAWNAAIAFGICFGISVALALVGHTFEEKVIK